MKELGVSRVKEDTDWVYVPEVWHYVGKTESKIVEELREELADRKYIDLTHGRRSSHRRGCRGPLCRRAQREYMREYMRKSRGYVAERNAQVRKYDYLLVLWERAYLARLAERRERRLTSATR